MKTGIIHPSLTSGNNVSIGNFCVIEENVILGDDVQIGNLVTIEPDVQIMNRVKIGHKVTLKSGTRIADDSVFDDHCVSTGVCYVGKNVNVRTGAIISRSTIIEDNCFIGPGVITNHTKHVSHAREKSVPNVVLLTYISYASIVGSQASLLAGIHIGPQCIIGGGSVVTKDLEGHAVYVGSPCRKLSDLPSEYLIDEPKEAGEMYMTDEIIHLFKSYMPNLVFKDEHQ
jgi:UDP-2-acetamido-3-amino-2,3-dideoxy-glucuronate N-acetyltransferase